MAENEKNAYQLLFDSIKEKTTASNRSKGRPSASMSKSDLDNMAYTMMNTPEHEETVYPYSAKDTTGTGTPVGVPHRPVARYRQSLKPIAKALGVTDKKDLEYLDDMVFPKEHAAAVMDFANSVIHDYIKAGRKYVFTPTDPDEARMEIMASQAPERTSIGNRFKKEEDGASNTVTVTKARTVIKAKNSVPFWLKETRERG